MDVSSLRSRFPALALSPGHPAGEADVALDNAATTHRPQAVLDELTRFYIEDNANVHRAVHRRARAATEAYESARRRVARFLEAETGEIVFTRNATEAINLVARSFVEPRVGPGRSIVVTALEHHSNLVPWQQVARRTGATLVVLPVDARGRLVQPVQLPADAAFLAATRVSNALGTIVDTERLVADAHAAGIPVLLDITQAAGHLPLDEGSRAADFLALSAHKMYGPMGLGVLRGRAAQLAVMEPVSFGGEMVTHVRAQEADWQDPPLRFEAGTPPVAEAVAFVAALDLIEEAGLPAIRVHELELLEHMLEGLAAIEGITVVGPETAAERSGSVSMTLSGDDCQVAATVLDLAGVAVRAGFHCAEPLLTGLGCGPTLRASVALYTSHGDVDRLLAALPDAVSAAG